MTHQFIFRKQRRLTLISVILGSIIAILFLQNRLFASEDLKEVVAQPAGEHSLLNDQAESLLDVASTPLSTSSFNGFTSGAYSHQITGGGVNYKVNFELSDEGNFGYLAQPDFEPAIRSQNTLSADGTIVSYLPDVMKNHDGMSTIFSLENPSGSDIVIFVIYYYDRSGSTILITDDLLGPGETQTVSLKDLGHLPDGYRGSVQIASNNWLDIKDVRAEDEKHNLKSAYKEGGTGIRTLVAPTLFKNHNFQTTELCIQNTDSEVANISVQYSDGETTTAILQKKGSICFNQGDEAHADDWHGGALITSNAYIAGFVRAVLKEGDAPTGRWAYSLADSSRVGEDVAIPLLLTSGTYSQWTSTIYYYNFGSEEATITPRYILGSDNVAEDCPDPFKIPPNSVGSISMPGDLLFADVAGAFFKSTGSVAFSVVNKNLDAAGTNSDQTFAYGADYLHAGPPIPAPENCDKVIPQYTYLPIFVAP